MSLREIKLLDTTLRDGEQAPGCSMHLEEKLEIAAQLEKLRVDIIEAGFAVASPGDFKAVKAIAERIKDCRVASLARARREDIDRAYEALKGAAAPRIHVFLATSPIHMRHKLRMSEEAVLEAIADSVGYARGLVEDVEFSCEDATRSDPAFLAAAVGTAVSAGAGVIGIPDTVGYAGPAELAELIGYLLREVPDIGRVTISAHCHNDLGQAVANSLAAVRAGAGQVECTLNGIGERAGNAALEEVVMALRVRGDLYGGQTRVNTERIYRASRVVSRVTGMEIPKNKAVIGDNAFAHEAGIHQQGMLADRATYEIISPGSVGFPERAMVLGKHSGRHALEERLRELGYAPTKEQVDRAFVRFKELADRKKTVSNRDLEALMANREAESPEYRYEYFTVRTDRAKNAAATITLSRGGVKRTETVTALGALNAAFQAIDRIVGIPVKLEDYTLHAVTEERDAQAEAMVRLSYGGESFIGRSVSIDVVEGSIKAYINGINKIQSAHKAVFAQNL